MAEQQQPNEAQQQTPAEPPAPTPEVAQSIPADVTAPTAPAPAEAAPEKAAAPEARPAHERAPDRGRRMGGARPGGARPGGARPGGSRQGRDRDRRAPIDDEAGGVESSVVRIYRCAKVVKGGRTFSFGALVVAGDRQGSVGIGYGKANEVPQSVEKATKDARKAMFKINLKGTTIPHVVKGSAGASSVVLVPARPGTGVTAGKSVRPCLELAGITDVLSKAYGSTSPKNLVKATIAALKQLQAKEQVERIRGVALPAHAGEIQ